MKKWLALVLTVALLLTMAACGKSNDPLPTEIGQPKPSGSSQESTPAIVETQGDEDGDWGTPGKMSIFPVVLHFSWPHVEGRTAGSGKASNQTDGSFVLADRYIKGSSPEDVALQDFYPAYVQQTINDLSDFYGYEYQNAKITADNGEILTIGEYEVCRFAGTHSYMLGDKSYERQFVVYATTAKADSTFVYWFVEDITDDQSAGKLLDENARRIIASINEESL